MSWRTVVEINHDHLADLDDPELWTRLRRFLQSGCPPEQAPYLGHIRVLATRHHSDKIKLVIE